MQNLKHCNKSQESSTVELGHHNSARFLTRLVESQMSLGSAITYLGREKLHETQIFNDLVELKEKLDEVMSRIKPTVVYEHLVPGSLVSTTETLNAGD